MGRLRGCVKKYQIKICGDFQQIKNVFSTYLFVQGPTEDKCLKSLLFTVYATPLLTDFIPPPPHPPSKSGLKLVCNVNIVLGNLKSDNSQDYAQKPQQNCTFMNSASGVDRTLGLSQEQSTSITVRQKISPIFYAVQ